MIVLAAVAVAVAVAVARHLYRVAVGRKPSTLQRIRDDVAVDSDTVYVVLMSSRVAEELDL